MGCLKGHFDFSLDYYDCNKFTFKDQSIWTENKRGEYVLSILTPLNVTKTFSIVAPLSEIISAEELEMSCLKDGIYEFSVTNCGRKYTKSKAILCQAECGINKLIAKGEGKKDIEKINLLKFYAEAVKVNSEQGRPNQAKKYFTFLQDELRRLHCECYC